MAYIEQADTGGAGRLTATSTPFSRTTTNPSSSSEATAAAVQVGCKDKDRRSQACSSNANESRDGYSMCYKNGLYEVMPFAKGGPAPDALPASCFASASTPVMPTPPRPAAAPLAIAPAAARSPSAPRGSVCALFLTTSLTLAQIVLSVVVLCIVDKLRSHKSVAGGTAMVAGVMSLVLCILLSVIKGFRKLGAFMLRMVLAHLWVVAAGVITCALPHDPAHLLPWQVHLLILSWVLCVLCLLAIHAEVMWAASITDQRPTDVEAGKE